MTNDKKQKIFCSLLPEKTSGPEQLQRIDAGKPDPRGKIGAESDSGREKQGEKAGKIKKMPKKTKKHCKIGGNAQSFHV